MDEFGQGKTTGSPAWHAVAVHDDEPTFGRVLAGVAEGLAAAPLVNLVGPLGSGKSWTLAHAGLDVVVDLTVPGASARLSLELATAGRRVGVDGLDRTATVALAGRLLEESGPVTARQVVLASRTPLDTQPGWSADAPVKVMVRELSDEEIDDLLVARGLTAPEDRAVVRGLSGGNPFVAESLATAICRGAPSSEPGGLADLVAEAILQRLGAELPATQLRRSLRLLAVVGISNQEILDLKEDEFDLLAGLSIVDRTGLGLAVAEPFRTVLDLSLRWRAPLERRDTLDRAFVHRVRMMSETSDAEVRTDLMLHGMFLADEPFVRAMMFPPRPRLPVISAARASDAEDIGAMMRQWATTSELDVRATERLVDGWLRGPIEHFQLTRDETGRGVALAHLIPFGEAERSGIEPVAQQFTEPMLADPGGTGTFLISGFWQDQANSAAMLHHILSEGIRHGRIVVCTPKPDYQRLCRGLGLQYCGDAQHDTFGRGHATQVFAQHTQPEDLPAWAARLGRITGLSPGRDYLAGQLVRALDGVRDPSSLDRTALLASPHTSTVTDLRGWLATAVQNLVDSEVEAEAEAGEALDYHYLRRTHGRAPTVADLGLDRAAYSRRLSRGVNLLTERFRAEGARLLDQPPLAALPGEQPGLDATVTARPGTLDQYIAGLQQMRAGAGNPSYADLARRIEQARSARGLPAGECRLSRVTVYDCFRLGRHRLDVELVVEIVTALGVSRADGQRWRSTYGALASTGLE